MIQLFSFVVAAFARAIGGGEAGLVAEVARGDRAALRQLYERFGRRVLGVAAKVLGTAGEAEDVVQEVFLEVWHHASRFDAARGSVQSWILSIARHRAVDRARRRKPVAEEDRMQTTATTEPSPLEAAEATEARVRVQRALAELTIEQRKVIELAFFEGLTQSEIAARLGDPLGTVKGRVRAAMGVLQAELERTVGRPS